MVVTVNHSDEVQPTGDSISHKLDAKTSLFGLRLYLLIGISIAVACLIAAFLLIFFCLFRTNRRSARKRIKDRPSQSWGSAPLFCKEIEASLDRTNNDEKAEVKIGNLQKVEKETEVVAIEGGRDKGESDVAGGSYTDVSAEEQNIGWGRWYSLKELEVATRRFSKENVIGEGGYGIVYRGVLPDGSVVAVKNLLDNNKGQAEKEFEVEVEAIGKVRHKNLVCLLGYCAEGAQRMLVYEFVNNGNLEQWLHGDVGPVSPLTWDIRMRIAVGTAKGIAYLHEGLEPKVVHRDIKSSNILLDRKWNAKVSDFGLAKLLGTDASYVKTRVMGTFGYVSPDYASTGMLNETNDVYSFGILLVEIITGRSPIDYSRPAGEMNFVDWFKSMVASRRGEEAIDPLVEAQPSSRALKRTLLVCLRCIDMDPHKRPKMGQIVHMLEGDDFPFRSEPRIVRERDSHCSRAEMSDKVTFPLKHGAVGDIERSERR